MGIQKAEVNRRPYVVKRAEIPSAGGVHRANLRPFLANQQLSAALSASTSELAWLTLSSGDGTGPHRHPGRGLLIVLQGSAQLSEAAERHIEAGDVVTLPADQAYAITVAHGDFEALQVVFPSEAAATAEALGTIDSVFAENDRRLRAWLETPYFCMLRDGTLTTHASRTRFKQCIRVFSDFFQVFLFTRQAACREPAYYAVFHEHLEEEFGHNTMLAPQTDPRVCQDPNLRATLSWFCHQMLIQDNAGKAIINLVLESAGYHFHNAAKPGFQSDDMASYFATHAEDDERHMEMGLELLRGEHPATYRALFSLVDRAWDMLEATTERIFELVHFNETAS